MLLLRTSAMLVVLLLATASLVAAQTTPPVASADVSVSKSAEATFTIGRVLPYTYQASSGVCAKKSGGLFFRVFSRAR